jgi:outer membrane protein W
MRSGFVLPLVLAFLAVPMFAQSNDVAVWYSTSRVDSTNEGASGITFKNGRGYGASFNHFFGKHLSTEFAYDQLRYQGRLNYLGDNVLDLGKLKTKVATAVLQWHFSRAGFIDPYVGAGAAYIKSDALSSADLTAAGIGDVSIEKKWGWVADGGVNVNFSRGVAVAVDAKYVPYEPNSGATNTKLKLNPTIFSAGLRFRF